MSRFAHVLQRAEREIRAPEPVRSQTLLELGADLEGAYRSYVARGFSEQEAAQRAEALLALELPALRELNRLHAPWYAHVLQSDTREAAVQRALLVALSGLAVSGGMYALIASDLVRDPPAASWLIMILSAVIVWTAVTTWLQTRAESAAVRRGRALLRRLAVLCWSQLVIAALSSMYTIAQLGRSGSAPELSVVMHAIGRAAELMTLSLSIALSGYVTWFLLYRQVTHLDRLHAELQHWLNPEPEDVS